MHTCSMHACMSSITDPSLHSVFSVYLVPYKLASTHMHTIQRAGIENGNNIEHFINLFLLWFLNLFSGLLASTSAAAAAASPEKSPRTVTKSSSYTVMSPAAGWGRDLLISCMIDYLMRMIPYTHTYMLIRCCMLYNTHQCPSPWIEWWCMHKVKFVANYLLARLQVVSTHAPCICRQASIISNCILVIIRSLLWLTSFMCGLLLNLSFCNFLHRLSWSHPRAWVQSPLAKVGMSRKHQMYHNYIRGIHAYSSDIYAWIIIYIFNITITRWLDQSAV